MPKYTVQSEETRLKHVFSTDRDLSDDELKSVVAELDEPTLAQRRLDQDKRVGESIRRAILADPSLIVGTEEERESILAEAEAGPILARPIEHIQRDVLTVGNEVAVKERTKQEKEAQKRELVTPLEAAGLGFVSTGPELALMASKQIREKILGPELTRRIFPRTEDMEKIMEEEIALRAQKFPRAFTAGGWAAVLLPIAGPIKRTSAIIGEIGSLLRAGKKAEAVSLFKEAAREAAPGVVISPVVGVGIREALGVPTTAQDVFIDIAFGGLAPASPGLVREAREIIRPKPPTEMITRAPVSLRAVGPVLSFSGQTIKNTVQKVRDIKDQITDVVYDRLGLDRANPEDVAVAESLSHSLNTVAESAAAGAFSPTKRTISTILPRVVGDFTFEVGAILDEVGKTIRQPPSTMGDLRALSANTALSPATRAMFGFLSTKGDPGLTAARRIVSQAAIASVGGYGVAELTGSDELGYATALYGLVRIPITHKRWRQIDLSRRQTNDVLRWREALNPEIRERFMRNFSEADQLMAAQIEQIVGKGNVEYRSRVDFEREYGKGGGVFDADRKKIVINSESSGAILVDLPHELGHYLWETDDFLKARFTRLYESVYGNSGIEFARTKYQEFSRQAGSPRALSREDTLSEMFAEDFAQLTGRGQFGKLRERGAPAIGTPLALEREILSAEKAGLESVGIPFKTDGSGLPTRDLAGLFRDVLTPNPQIQKAAADYLARRFRYLNRAADISDEKITDFLTREDLLKNDFRLGASLAVRRDAGGRPISFLTPAQQKRMEREAGQRTVEWLAERAPREGEAWINVPGRKLPDGLLEFLVSQGRLSQGQAQFARMIETQMANQQNIQGWYQPAYLLRGNMPVDFKQITPHHLEITQVGNITMDGLDMIAAEEKIIRWIEKKKEIREAFGTAENFRNELLHYLENLRAPDGVRSDQLFGPVKHKLLNAFFNVPTDLNEKTAILNNLRAKRNKDQLWKSYRLDRWNTMDLLDREPWILDYHRAKGMYRPEVAQIALEAVPGRRVLGEEIQRRLTAEQKNIFTIAALDALRAGKTVDRVAEVLKLDVEYGDLLPGSYKGESNPFIPILVKNVREGPDGRIIAEDQAKIMVYEAALGRAMAQESMGSTKANGLGTAHDALFIDLKRSPSDSEIAELMTRLDKKYGEDNVVPVSDVDGIRVLNLEGHPLDQIKLDSQAFVNEIIKVPIDIFPFENDGTFIKGGIDGNPYQETIRTLAGQAAVRPSAIQAAADDIFNEIGPVIDEAGRQAGITEPREYQGRRYFFRPEVPTAERRAQAPYLPGLEAEIRQITARARRARPISGLRPGLAGLARGTRGDTPESTQSFIAANARTAPSRSPGYKLEIEDRQVEENALLGDWALQENRWISQDIWKWASKPGAEHFIVRGLIPDRIVKITDAATPIIGVLDKGWGLTADVYQVRPGVSEMTLQEGSPWMYLERIRLQNKLFKDDIRVEGVVRSYSDPGILDIVTSQPFIQGTMPSWEEIKSFFTRRKFRKIDDKTFYHDGKGILVMDAHRENLKKVGKKLVPTDLVVVKLSPEEQQLMQMWPLHGKGGPPPAQPVSVPPGAIRLPPGVRPPAAPPPPAPPPAQFMTPGFVQRLGAPPPGP